jgi:hypothetical protein
MRWWIVCLGMIGCRWAFDPLATFDAGVAGQRDGDSDGVSSGSDAAADQLVAWYECEDDFSDQRTDDSTGHGHAAQCTGPCPAITPGRVSNGLTGFQGMASSGLEILDHPRLRPATMTFTAWVRWQPGSGFSTLIAKPLGTGTANSYHIDFDDTGIPRFTTSDGTAMSRVTTTALPSGAWTHLAGTFDGTSLRMYVDGALVDQSPAPPPAYDANNVYIGADRNGGTPSQAYDGALDEVRIYSVALSQAEILQLAQ